MPDNVGKCCSLSDLRGKDGLQRNKNKGSRSLERKYNLEIKKKITITRLWDYRTEPGLAVPA